METEILTVNRFHIDDSFAISPNIFVFAGTLVEGEAKAGMIFELPEAGNTWRVVVKAVEFVDRPGGVALIGLRVQNENFFPGFGKGITVELR